MNLLLKFIEGIGWGGKIIVFIGVKLEIRLGLRLKIQGLKFILCGPSISIGADECICKKEVPFWFDI